MRYLFLVMILGLAVILIGSGITLAQDQPQLTSVYYPDPLPLTDPFDPMWDEAPALDVTLTPQLVAMPTLADISVPQVTVRSANDGHWISFLLTWEDDTQDIAATRPDQFRDAAAIQLPVGDALPSVTMGSIGQMVKIWHWKADWQADIDYGFQDVVDAYPNFWNDYYPFAIGEPPYRVPEDFSSADARAFLIGWEVGNPLSNPHRVTPVEVAKAEGFGTLTHHETQDVTGRGVWEDGRWRVVFSRPLVSADANGSHFAPGETTSAAFAVWNGSNQEVGARKQISSWVSMLVEAAPAPDVPPPPEVAPTGVQPAYVIGGLLLAVVLTILVTMFAIGGLRRSI